MRGLIEHYAGQRPGVTAKPLDNTMFMMWDACVPGFVSLSLYRLPPIKGTVTLRMDADLIAQLVDRFYGGRGPKHQAGRHEFTPTEQRLIAIITASLRMEAKQETLKFAHEAIPPRAFPSRMAA